MHIGREKKMNEREMTGLIWETAKQLIQLQGGTEKSRPASSEELVERAWKQALDSLQLELSEKESAGKTMYRYVLYEVRNIFERSEKKMQSYIDKKGI
jgi:hypothetical protein